MHRLFGGVLDRAGSKTHPEAVFGCCGRALQGVAHHLGHRAFDPVIQPSSVKETVQRHLVGDHVQATT